ncbi:flagellar hook assembly protein FlgD [Polycladidibacter hongkongensis]|uniref:flagellar hook assembly protein FlgD n=1 Tax=Polycladidibacter hongkongensis TaxID=1647556 RepID=UPI0009EC507C|nr:flagellar hook assembly protein FlgD [Pseudovibrio hongkongensis]
MTVSAVAPTNTASSQAAPKSQAARDKSFLDYQAFLKLFMASLKNQDPTKPMDTAEYMGQLAQFSNVEQAVQTNTKLAALLQQNSVDQAASLIGKTLTTADGVTGTIKSIQIFSDGNVAVLEDGTKVIVGPGVTISSAAAPAKATDDATSDTPAEAPTKDA